MCIVLATTAHPSYSLIIIDNRDEFITRPTSKPHWWSSPNQEILSSRDLLRKEQGTWLGITKNGNFAVLTNFREDNTHDPEHPIRALRSRGEMVTAWLTGPHEESTERFVHRLLDNDGVKGVGGFSLLCGKLRKRKGSGKEIEPLAIISNRSGTPDDVPWVAEKREEVYGLSNSAYDDPTVWPKVTMGKDKVLETVRDAAKSGLGKEELIEKLYAVLDTDTLPAQGDQDFESYLFQLRNSIFIPSIGAKAIPAELPKADQIASADIPAEKGLSNGTPKETKKEENTGLDGMFGVYGTQRQTVILVDWEGNVTYTERSLYDAEGEPIQRGKGDMRFEFRVDGWDGDSKL